MQKQQSQLSDLKLVTAGLTSIILMVLGMVLPGSVCFHFLEANSQNCGSLCRGYSLVITYLTSSTW